MPRRHQHLKEIGRLHDWPGKLVTRRYRSINVSKEEEDQVGRLRYLLAAGVKEQLVEKAIEWPGVHSARALIRDHPLRGWWFDRTRERAARRRGEAYGRFEYATEETVFLDPLPCWRDTSSSRLDILRRRLIERRREEIGGDIREAREALEAGRCHPSTPDEIFDEIAPPLRDPLRESRRSIPALRPGDPQPMSARVQADRRRSVQRWSGPARN